MNIVRLSGVDGHAGDLAAAGPTRKRLNSPVAGSAASIWLLPRRANSPLHQRGRRDVGLHPQHAARIEPSPSGQPNMSPLSCPRFGRRRSSGRRASAKRSQRKRSRRRSSPSSRQRMMCPKRCSRAGSRHRDPGRLSRAARAVVGQRAVDLAVPGRPRSTPGGPSASRPQVGRLARLDQHLALARRNRWRR